MVVFYDISTKFDLEEYQKLKVLQNTDWEWQK